MKTVLVVDDNHVLCRLACDILRRDGYRAIPASNATEALAAFEKEEFDLLLTDLRMPGMNGLELARAIHDKNPRLPVIVMTAFGLVEADDIKVCLPKEDLFPGLLEKIQLCLSEAEAETVEQYDRN
ncbi:MAG TPA: response regulator [Terriglobales bacterium]|jgi:CheY-like chemotaxis protein|nr:response regulator [Terriglobales bacterium]